MACINLSVNKKIEILKDEEVYKSIVQDVNSEMFSINMPVNEGVYLPLHNDEEVSFLYYIEQGGCLSFKGTVVDRVKENNMNLYKISKLREVKKIQRRNFVRVDAIEYTFYKKTTSGSEEKWHKGIIVDLSGGGVKFKISEKVKLHEKLKINIYVNEEKLTLNGVIVRADKTYDKEYMCGIEFLDLSERERDKIISKVFELMRKQRVTQ